VENTRLEQVNGAAEKFADALTESYRAISERGVAAQTQSAQLVEDLFNQGINDLRNHAEGNRAMTQQLVDHKLRAEEAKRTLAQESVGAYMEFVNSLISLPLVTPEAAKRAQERSR
jgi:hypothetical protein